MALTAARIKYKVLVGKDLNAAQIDAIKSNKDLSRTNWLNSTVQIAQNTSEVAKYITEDMRKKFLLNAERMAHTSPDKVFLKEDSPKRGQVKKASLPAISNGTFSRSGCARSDLFVTFCVWHVVSIQCTRIGFF